MLKPKVKASEFKKFGFKRCKGIPKELECYYLCVARGCEMLFVSDVCFAVNDWNKDDPRIHKDANCRYRDKRTALDIIYELIKADMLKSEWEIEEQPTAFDVEKVLNELKHEESEALRRYSESKGTAYAFSDKCSCNNWAKAIEIINRGGVDEK